MRRERLFVGVRRGAMRVRENRVFVGAPKDRERVRARLVIGSEAVSERVTDWVRFDEAESRGRHATGRSREHIRRRTFGVSSGVARLRSRAGTWIFRQRENERRIFKG